MALLIKIEFLINQKMTRKYLRVIFIPLSNKTKKSITRPESIKSPKSSKLHTLLL